jgi:hypothetical protein
MGRVPAFTALDAVLQGTTALAYLVVGLAAWVAARGDMRTRVFLGAALANVVAFGVPAVNWIGGMRTAAGLSRGGFAAVFCSLAAGSVLLFHFFQVFPWRRPWIRRWWRVLPPLYVIAPVGTAAVVLLAPATFEEVTLLNLAILLAAGLPVLGIVAVLLPIGGILSLVKSYRESAHTDPPRRAMRRPLLLMLVSQIAGGTIGVLFAPVLGAVAPGSTAQAALKIAAWASGLLMPGAFAIAAWPAGLPADAAPTGNATAAATADRRA